MIQNVSKSIILKLINLIINVNILKVLKIVQLMNIMINKYSLIIKMRNYVYLVYKMINI